MRKRICGAALAVAALGAFSTASAAHAAAIERGFDVSPGGLLVVDAQWATVNVRGGSENVRIEISREDDDAAAIEADYNIAFERTDAGVELRVVPKEQLLPRLRWRGVKIAVQVPEDYRADVASSGGSVSVAGLNGDVAARTSGGKLRLEALPGAVSGRTSGGSIRHAGTSASVDFVTTGGAIFVDEVAGEANTQTSGGSITVGRAGGAVAAKTSGGSIRIGSAGDAVSAKTSGGSIRATFAAQPTAASSLVTSGGSIQVWLAPELAVDVNASSSGGRVRLEDGIEVEGDMERRRLAGTVNGGGPRLSLRTSGGSIVLQPM